jgi:large subunit ribosomal protein L9
MEVVLLERVESLGQMGDVVTVKPGFARNFLIPRKKALRATKENLNYFETQRKTLETVNLQSKKEAENASSKMQNVTVTIVRQAAESGKLYGSVSTRDIADALSTAGYKVDRSQLTLVTTIKTLGLFQVKITLHPEVILMATANVARTEEEAKIQLERGAALVKDANAKESANDQPAVPADAFLDKAEQDAA